MSKLDRQLDQVSGEKKVAVVWPKDADVDVVRLRERLISEIDGHNHRIPLDLRGVHGAPPALVEILIDLQKYARSEGKLLSISYALPPMQDALNPRRRRKAGRPSEAIDEDGQPDASEVAKSLLVQDEVSEYDIGKAREDRSQNHSETPTETEGVGRPAETDWHRRGDHPGGRDRDRRRVLPGVLRHSQSDDHPQKRIRVV